MKQYAGIEKDAQYLVDMMYAPMYTKICMRAIEMDIFSHLTEDISAEDLAKKLEWHAVNTGLFLDALAGMKLLTKTDGVYRNTLAANKYLVRSSDYFMGGYMLMCNKFNESDVSDISLLVQKGPQPMPEGATEQFYFAEQISAMRFAQMGARSKETVDVLSSLPEFTSSKKMLDLGCGTGMLGIAVAKANAELSAVLFDTPAMGKGIEESIKQSGIEERLRAMAGDYMSDDIGEGYDLIIAVGTLNFAKHAMDTVMEKLYSALNKGGILVTSGDGIYSEGTMPIDMVSSWLTYAMQGMNFGMPINLIPDAAERAGFRSIRSFTVPSYSGTANINVIRK